SGDREEAERRFHAASAWIFANDNAYLKPYTLLDAGVLALHDGDRERACRLIAAANRIFEDTESIPDPDDRVELDTAVDRLKWDELQASDALLLGRRTYEGFASAWPTMTGTGEFGEKMNSMPKYVVSSTLDKLEWRARSCSRGTWRRRCASSRASLARTYFCQ